MSYKNNNYIKILKLTIFWSIVCSVFLLFALAIKYEIKPRQRPVEIEINIKNKVNICLPEEKVENL